VFGTDYPKFKTFNLLLLDVAHSMYLHTYFLSYDHVFTSYLSYSVHATKACGIGDLTSLIFVPYVPAPLHPRTPPLGTIE
jgi:hypothetical protein